MQVVTIIVFILVATTDVLYELGFLLMLAMFSMPIVAIYTFSTIKNRILIAVGIILFIVGYQYGESLSSLWFLMAGSLALMASSFIARKN